MTITTRASIGTLILRIGLAFVFFYFGLNQLHNPQQWISYLPTWLPLSNTGQVQLVLMNGLFEIISAVLLVFGTYTRLVTLLLALHLFGIAYSIGLNPIGVRDIGLAIATLTLTFMGAGGFSLDAFAQPPTSTPLSTLS